MIIKISRVSKEFIYVTVTAGGPDRNRLTTLPIDFAFFTTRSQQPITSDWIDGEWDPDTGEGRCLIGPGSPSVLAPGTHYVWVRVRGTLEIPVAAVGGVNIT